MNYGDETPWDQLEQQQDEEEYTEYAERIAKAVYNIVMPQIRAEMEEWREEMREMLNRQLDEELPLAVAAEFDRQLRPLVATECDVWHSTLLAALKDAAEENRK
jgi:hypothetical protein